MWMETMPMRAMSSPMPTTVASLIDSGVACTHHATRVIHKGLPWPHPNPRWLMQTHLSHDAGGAYQGQQAHQHPCGPHTPTVAQ